MRLSLFIIIISSIISLKASASIIGMLGEDEKTKVELVDGKNGVIRIAITSEYNIPGVYFSRYLGGEGGDTRALMAALQQGKVPPAQTIADWMPDTNRESLKIGIFTSNEKHSYNSFFTGQRVNLEVITSRRESVRDLGNGLRKQIFAFTIDSIAEPKSVERLLKGEMDLVLVTQTRTADGFEMEMKKSLILNLTDIKSGNSCNNLFK